MSAFSSTSLPPILRLGDSGDAGYTVRLSTSLSSPPRGLIRRHPVMATKTMLVEVLKTPAARILSRPDQKTGRRKSKH